MDIVISIISFLGILIGIIVQKLAIKGKFMEHFVNIDVKFLNGVLFRALSPKKFFSKFFRKDPYGHT